MSEATPAVPAAATNEVVLKSLGITQEQLDAFKKDHVRVEVVKIGGRFFLYRALKRSELKAIRQGVQGGDDLVQEEKIVARCLLVPKLDEMALRDDDAGLATTLCEHVYHFSGYAAESAPVKL